MDRLLPLLRRAGVEVGPVELFELSRESIPFVRIPGQSAIEVWTRARGVAQETARWPVVLGEPEELRFFDEASDDDRRTSELVSWAEGHSTPPFPWIESRRAEAFEQTGDEEDAPPPQDPEADFPSKPVPNTQFQSVHDYRTHKPLASVLLAFLPTSQGWHAPAILRWGGWNDNPLPEQHASLFRHWEERYGAEPVVMTHDVVEMRVKRPPRTRAEAIELAWMQAGYCSDIVWQGVNSVGALAGILLNAPVWYFWWD